MISFQSATWPAALAHAVTVGLLFCIRLTALAGEPSGRDLGNVFALDGQACILEETHCGIANGHLTVGIPFKTVGRIDGLWAPPFVSSDFQLRVTVGEKEIPSTRFTWWPHKVLREGQLAGIKATSTTLLAADRRGGLLAIILENTTAEAEEITLGVSLKGTLDRTEAWEFAAPSSTTPTQLMVVTNRLIAQQGELGIVLAAGSNRLDWDVAAATGRIRFALAPGSGRTFYLGFAAGPLKEAAATSSELVEDPEKMIQAAEDAYLYQVRGLFDRLPRLESNNLQLDRFYQRSLVHLVLNRWMVSEFKLRPYYGTGSVKGGCLCSYLWNFGEVWEILPLYDPAATRSHIKQFLSIDLMAHFAFNPLTGQGFGPWYMVNQEKIIGLIFYYVKITADTSFLQDTVNGKTILDHVVAQAFFGDDATRPIALMDYGSSNSHLELRRGYPYNHVMPDLNGRRYANYVMASELAEMAGRPVPALKQRAEALKTELKSKLWNPRSQWFDFQDAQGRKDTRYTIQMFKLFNSPVLDQEEEAGLLAHLNEKESLGDFGLHSLSKTDIAYDQVDIDNGGGGSCTSFAPQIAERLYKAGHSATADDLLRRILWWGERMPYWGDSLVANQIDYRKDTPLQCTIDGAAAAQCLIFGLFGVEPRFDGTVLVHPHSPAFASKMALQGLKLRGMTLDISVNPDGFRIRTPLSETEAKAGESILVDKQGKILGITTESARKAGG